MAKLHLFLIILTLLSFTTAEIETIKVTSDSRQMIVFQKFGFTHAGHLSMSASVSSSYSSTDPSRLGFFLLSEESYIQVLLELMHNPSFCIIDSKFIYLLFTFRDLSSHPHSSFNQSYPVTVPNEYSLYFANCVAELQVTMDVRTELYNLDSGASKDYLSAGLTQLPSIYFLFFLIYSYFLGFWLYHCYRTRRSVHRIHLLMTLLIITQTLNLVILAKYKQCVKVTGTAHKWNILVYAFQLIRVLLLSTVIISIGTWWSFLEPSLQGKGGKKVLMIVIPLQVLSNVASMVIGETSPFTKDWVTWRQGFLLVDIVCCFTIIFSIRSSLRKASKMDGKAARNLGKLSVFRKFYIVGIGYLFYTRIVVFALLTITTYKYQWVAFAAEEIGSLVFYMVMFYMFRPMEENQYFDLDKEAAKEAAEITLWDPLSGRGVWPCGEREGVGTMGSRGR
ncbi:unnamed protein product [Ilex paraguariensis]|uniref:Uncharacterized protein n=1 Tax=Ilex paraguariensis TaxID=185542 RepID=A0ABC8R697_9AQUA